MIIERLKNKAILVSDGAMGTSLQAMGLEPGEAPEQWNISHPEKVKGVHKGFIAVGSDMITTNTFGADIAEEFNKRGVEIAKDAARGKVYVLGDIGPTGKLLKPIGDYSEEDFYAVFFKKAKILAGAGIDPAPLHIQNTKENLQRCGVDAFIIETMSALDELKIAVCACKAAAKLPVIASMAFTATDKGYRTMMGASIEQAASVMLDMKCDVIGANCGCGSRQMVEVMKEFRKICGKTVFLIAQPNAGMPKLVNGEAVFDETPADFAKAISELVKLGVNIIGGCCGTTPEHINEISDYLRLSRGGA